MPTKGGINQRESNLSTGETINPQGNSSSRPLHRSAFYSVEVHWSGDKTLDESLLEPRETARAALE